MRSKTFLGTPMRHREVHVGSFFLAEKEGAAEFTGEDEEVLMLFASQAAPPSPTPAPTATISARGSTSRHWSRPRRSGRWCSMREVVVRCRPTARYGASSRGSHRGAPSEALLEVLSCRFADGREVALAELPLVRVLGDPTTMRAEEIVLTVPDGRSVRALVNVTPIRAGEGESGEVVSVVATLQDLAPLEELERQRAEFLGVVSHELRTPLAAIRDSAGAVLGATPALPPAEVEQCIRIIDAQARHMQGLIGNLLDAGRIEAGTLSVAPEPCEVAALVDRARTTFLSGGARHTLHIDLPAALPPVMADRERIVQVLASLLSNAARHSPESSPIRVEATREGAHVAVSVADRGRGCRRRCWGSSFASTSRSKGATPRAASRRAGSGSPSARGWSRRTEAASAPRARGRPGGRGSPSPSRWPRARRPAQRPARRRGARQAMRPRGPASSSSSSTRRRFARCAPRSTPGCVAFPDAAHLIWTRPILRSPTAA